jgi:gluconokinase
VPLTDEDRWPWLRLVGEALAAPPDGAVVACSALRRSYRDALRRHAPDTAFVHLVGTREQLIARLRARLDHFMPASLLDSQLRTLEPLEPDELGLVLDCTETPNELVDAVVRGLLQTADR